MHAFLSSLTAFLLAMHTVLGCCWHHAHHCEEASEAAGSVASADACDHSHGVPIASDDDGQNQHGRHDCQGTTCVFVGPTKAPPRGGLLHVEVLSVAETFDHASSIVRVAAGRCGDALNTRVSPLRLHLRCAVLLI
jgi:hypothetical protein